MKIVLLILALFSLTSCQSPGLFHEPFNQEMVTFKPHFEDQEYFEQLKLFAKTVKVETSRTIKTVDLNHIGDTCKSDFEIELVQMRPLPASNHQINHFNIGGVVPGQKASSQNLWLLTIGAVVKNLGEENSVYSLVYNLKINFDIDDYMNFFNIDSLNINQRPIVEFIFYMECVRIYEEELLPIKG